MIPDGVKLTWSQLVLWANEFIGVSHSDSKAFSIAQPIIYHLYNLGDDFYKNLMDVHEPHDSLKPS